MPPPVSETVSVFIVSGASALQAALDAFLVTHDWKDVLAFSVVAQTTDNSSHVFGVPRPEDLIVTLVYKT